MPKAKFFEKRAQEYVYQGDKKIVKLRVFSRQLGRFARKNVFVCVCSCVKCGCVGERTREGEGRQTSGERGQGEELNRRNVN